MTAELRVETVWSAIVLDDEALSRRRVEDLLAGDSEIHVVASTPFPEEAITLVCDRRPDLLFVDVQMPRMNGIELVRQLPQETLPLVVFVTAYDEYAVPAFDLHAVDYVLKPVDSERFAVAIERAKRRLLSESSAQRSGSVHRLLASGSGPAKLERIAVQARGRMRLLRLDEVKWFQAARNYVSVRASDAEYLLRETITGLEEKLDPQQFARIHRSTIVNIDFIHEFVPRAFGDYMVHIRGGEELLMSRRFRSRLDAFIGRW